MSEVPLLGVVADNDTRNVNGEAVVSTTKGVARVVDGKVATRVLLAILLHLPFYFFEFGGSTEASRTAAITVLLSTLWITEIIPSHVTSLVGVFMFPMLGVLPAKNIEGKTAVPSLLMNDMIILFISTCLLAQKTNLHRRIALTVLNAIGASPKRLMGGFMLGSALLSMWLSNTATANMMVPIAISTFQEIKVGSTSLEGDGSHSSAMDKYLVGLVLGIAYSSSCGGVATLTGSPTNLIMVGQLGIKYENPPAVTFLQWMGLGIPLCFILLLIIWSMFVFIYCRGVTFGEGDALKTKLRGKLDSLGKPSREENIVSVVFVILVLALFLRDPKIFPGFVEVFPKPKFVTDGTMSLLIILPLFLLNNVTEGGGANPPSRILTGASVGALPWNIVLLLGGGFVLAEGFAASGLSDWIGEQLAFMDSLPLIILLILLCTLITFTTEFTSNASTASIVVPILASVARSIQVNPFLLMVPATISCSFAFMFPIATPPNAIAYGTGLFPMSEMIRRGVILNLVGIFVCTFAMLSIGLPVYNIELGVYPEWANHEKKD